MSKKKSASASLACQQNGVLDDARETSLEKSDEPIIGLDGIIGLLMKASTWVARLKAGRCPMNPSLELGSCSGCRNPSNQPFSLERPPHRHEFKRAMHYLFEVIEKGLNKQRVFD